MYYDGLGTTVNAVSYCFTHSVYDFIVNRLFDTIKIVF